MNRLRTGAIALLAALGAAPGVTASAAASLGCGDAVQGRVVLTRDLTCPTGDGLVLTGDTELDLGGHRLTGGGRGQATALRVGVDATVESVVVRDGTLSAWGRGVQGAVLTSVDLDAVHLEGVELGLDADPRPLRVTVGSSTFTDMGMALFSWGGTVTVADSRFTRTVGAIHASTFHAAETPPTTTLTRTVVEGTDTGLWCFGGRLVVVGSTLQDNGVAVLGDDECDLDVSGSTFARNGTGIDTEMWSCACQPSLAGGRIVDSTFSDNDIGVELDTGPWLRGNRFTGNGAAIRSTVPRSTLRLERNVLTGNGDAIVVEGTVEVLRNRVVGNSGYGIYAPLATDLGGNVAHRNGVEPQCTGVVCRRS